MFLSFFRKWALIYPFRASLVNLFKVDESGFSSLRSDFVIDTDALQRL